MSLSKLKIVLALEAADLLREPKCRTTWVHSFNSERERNKRFEKFCSKIRKYDDKFFGYYRMSQKSFEELLEILRPCITKQNTVMRMAISAEQRLTITLR